MKAGLGALFYRKMTAVRSFQSDYSPFASKQTDHGVARLDKAAWAVEVIEIFRGRVNSDGVVECGEQVIWMHGVVCGPAAVVVGTPVTAASPDTTAGDEETLTFRPMVAATGTDVVCRLGADPGGTSKFADRHHKCRL